MAGRFFGWFNFKREIEVIDITTEDTQNVGGGILFLAPVVITMAADASFWGSMALAFSIGSKYGSFLYESSSSSSGSKTIEFEESSAM